MTRLNLTVIFSMVPILVAAAATGAVEDARELNGQKLHLRTGFFATPVEVPSDPEKRAITFIELQGELFDTKQSQGSITFHQSRLRFNDFGDATEIDEESPAPIRIAYQPVHEAGKKHRLFELVFPEGDFENRIYLSMTAGSVEPPHLLIGPGERVPSVSLAHRLPLHQVAGGKPLGSKERLRDHFSMTTRYFPSVHGRRAEPTLGYIQLGGVLGGKGTFTHDQNYVRFSPLTGRGSSTLMGFMLRPVKFQEVKITDPANAGRRLLKVNFADGSMKDRYSLVVCPEAAGPHRLIIRDGNNVTHVLPLRPYDQTKFYDTEPLLAQTPIAEQRAISEIRRLVKYNYYVDFKIESGTIVELRLSGGHGTDQTLRQLTHLRHLKHLDLTSCRELTPAGLAPLRDLQNLESLSFYCTPISDDGLRHFAGLRGLKFLNLDSGKITRNGMILGPRLTDAGLKHIEGLVNLESLTISGQGITDAGLAHLKGLTSLQVLSLLGTQVTLTGIIKLSEALPNTDIRAGWCRVRRKTGSLWLEGSGTSDFHLEQASALRGLKALNIHNMGNITDAGLENLTRFEALERLTMQHGRQITDAGLKHVGRLGKLRKLNLWYCRNITDNGADHLKGLTSLQELELGATKVSARGIDVLQEALPDCKIRGNH